MTTAFLIGNGLSREPIDLSKLKGDTYGCNLIYTEFMPDYLCLMDKKVMEKVLEDSINIIPYTWKRKQSEFSKQKVCKANQVNTLESDLHYRNSGLLSLELALEQKKYDTIYFLGYDLYTNVQREYINNVYKEDSLYRKNTKDHNPATGHIARFLRVFCNNNDINFIRVVNYEYSANFSTLMEDTGVLASRKLPRNYKEITIENFKDSHGC
jgi:hypothetical protein